MIGRVKVLRPLFHAVSLVLPTRPMLQITSGHLRGRRVGEDLNLPPGAGSFPRYTKCMYYYGDIWNLLGLTGKLKN